VSVRTYKPRLTWSEGGLSPEVLINLDRVLRSWARTPYSSGQRLKGRGADCIGSVFGVIDELDGRLRAQDPGLPQDTAMHHRDTAVVAMKEILRRYAPLRKLGAMGRAPLVVEPGDLLVTGLSNGGPGHLEMVGARKNELWHATAGPGFHQGGWSLLSEQVLYGVWRPEEKDRWIS
jgi:hypothetical protein